MSISSQKPRNMSNNFLKIQKTIFTVETWPTTELCIN